ncbi:hypothetical protein Taro_006141 [Colocasia esculenta]|uniref:DYW domain-containing protein n=1 Tax=Colocasia esculenta TaxID=4460 RepID=A0A843TWU3_COLES|nr:hypothetical protein [Colocasia esculenta]
MRVRCPVPIAALLQSPSTPARQVKQIHAQLLLHDHPPRSSLFFFNSMLLAYASSPNPSDGFSFFATARARFHRPNNFTFQFLLKASARARSLAQAAQVHCSSLKLGFGSYTFLQNGLLKCYCVCGRLVDARQLFDEVPSRDVVAFNTIIHGYAESGDMGSALSLFEQVPDPNPVTWTTMLVGSSAAGNVSAARRLFDSMPEKDLVAWNAMISAYVQNHRPLEALHLFVEMQARNLKPNQVTVATVLSACAAIGALDAGKWIHVYLVKNKFRLDPFLGSALVDMYCKCGIVHLALEVFENLREKNSCTWNALINGLAMNGLAERSLEMFERMLLDQSVRPDEVTFVGVLLACSHGGFVEEGRKHFYHTVKEYGVNLLPEHYACIVDLFARCGLLKEAEDIIRCMPIPPDIVVLRALLGGCRLHKNVDMAERVLSEMEAHGSGDYVLLSNLYASVGRWEDVEKVRGIMKGMGIKKVPGCSSIEINNTIHEFVSGDRSHPKYKEILDKLAELGRKMSTDGYLAETTAALYDIDEEEKEEALGHHSEKLAIGFGLISTEPGTPLRIVKNLRFCNDCHTWSGSKDQAVIPHVEKEKERNRNSVPHQPTPA